MKFTERDRRLLLWINGHGFVSVSQVAEWMGVSDPFAYSRVKKLLNGGYLKRDRVLHNSKRIHSLTLKGKAACGDDLPILNRVNLGTFIHDMKLVDLSLKLEKDFDGEFVPERRIKQLKGLSGVGKKGHSPDGILELTDKKIAVELELSVKSRSRLKEIMNEYARNLELNEIWYFTDSVSVRNAISRAAEQSGVYNLKIEDLPL